MSETTVLSFVLRFVQEPDIHPDTPPAKWRAVIRHVQTNEEHRFTRMEDALQFMNQFIDLESVIWIKENANTEGGETLT